MKNKRTRITFDFRTKKKKQLPLFMVIKEYYDEQGNIEFAKVLFEIKGRKYRKLCGMIEKAVRNERDRKNNAYYNFW